VPLTEIHRAGDCVGFDPSHRHGAAPTTTFAYINTQAARDGSAVTLSAPVTTGGSQ
jgi:hypothetical protein